MVVIGPGLSLQEETMKLVRELSAAIAKPLLIDGDGLTAVAERPEILLKRKAPTILTPHAGEMARLSRKTVAEVNADKIAVLRESAKKLNATVVFKGAHSLIGMTDGRVYVNLSGNPGMATAGSGDVLTGCIAAMLGRGLSPEAGDTQRRFPARLRREIWPRRQKARTVLSRRTFWNIYPWRSRMTVRAVSMPAIMSRR